MPSYLSTTTSPNLSHPKIQPTSKWLQLLPTPCSPSPFSFSSSEHPMTVGAVNACDVVQPPLIPCLIPFSSSNGSYTLSSSCCSGAALVAEENDSTPAGSIIVCLCLNALMTQFPLIRPQAVRNTFAKCNVSIPVRVEHQLLAGITLRYSSICQKLGD
ncbi:uncharacterized protein [Elaeis guineensis]|uniref:uncharacterized protein isoform X1 n=1 Tax=Elaeis guineensis var. tenera TaxID=51953 RepID=UPI003C6CF516